MGDMVGQTAKKRKKKYYLKAKFITLVEDFSDSSGQCLSVSLIKENVLLLVITDIHDNYDYLYE